jgi:phosphoglycerate dehydrogenase-like enzyme
VGRSVVFVAFDIQPQDRDLAAELNELVDLHYKKDLGDAELHRIMAIAEILIAGGWRGSITSHMVAAMPKLKLVQTLAAGVNHVPFLSLPESVIVSTGSGANSREVAEHALAMFLSAAKNIVRHTMVMKGGGYPHGEVSRMLEGKILGVLGMGSIGSRLSAMARCLGMTVIGCDVKATKAHLIDSFYEADRLRDFLREVDFLVVCVPLTNRTAGMIAAPELSVMKEGAVLVNVSRGAVIHERDMYQHLRENPSFTACLDVWWKYTSDGTFQQNLPFGDLENVLMTPHNATHSPHQRERMVKFAFDKVASYVKGEVLEGIADPADYV